VAALPLITQPSLTSSELVGFRSTEHGAKALFLHCGSTDEPTPEPIAHVAPVAAVAKPVQARCPHYKAIRAFFGCARGAMLDTRDEDAMRDALAAFVGPELETRADLSAGEWATTADAVRRGALVW
jgi:hypothetical protein